MFFHSLSLSTLFSYQIYYVFRFDDLTIFAQATATIDLQWVDVCIWAALRKEMMWFNYAHFLFWCVSKFKMIQLHGDAVVVIFFFVLMTKRSCCSKFFDGWHLCTSINLTQAPQGFVFAVEMTHKCRMSQKIKNELQKAKRKCTLESNWEEDTNIATKFDFFFPTANSYVQACTWCNGLDYRHQCIPSLWFVQWKSANFVRFFFLLFSFHFCILFANHMRMRITSSLYAP